MPPVVAAAAESKVQKMVASHVTRRIPKYLNRPGRKEKATEKPEAMSWSRGTPYLLIAGIFDVLREMCENLWFFGPAFIGVAAYIWSGSEALGWVAGIAGGTAEFFTGPVVEMFGVVMAEAVGLIGWGVVFTAQMMFNPRIFKADSGNALWFFGSLVVAEIPIVGMVPSLTVATWRALRVQIKKEQAELKKWEDENAARIARQKAEQIAQYQQARAYQISQQNQEAADFQAANDNEEIAEEERIAA